MLINYIKKLIEKFKLEEIDDISDIDVPHTSLIHAQIIQNKPFLIKLYTDFYKDIISCFHENIENKCIVELGSGGGFIKKIIPSIITSDILETINVDYVFSAMDMPFKDSSIDAFVMIDVFHHMNDIKAFFNEVIRCLKIGGKVVMIEPANTLWSRFIYKNFHHESFNISGGWTLEKRGPYTTANGAIPWIIFFRDRRIFEEEFSLLQIRSLKIHTPFRYILSGGLTTRQVVPSFLYSVVYFFENLLSPLNKYIGMFLTIELQKK